METGRVEVCWWYLGYMKKGFECRGYWNLVLIVTVIYLGWFIENIGIFNIMNLTMIDVLCAWDLIEWFVFFSGCVGGKIVYGLWK